MSEEIYIKPWSWEESNGNATDEQTVSSYNALINKGNTADFSKVVWNDLIDKIKETLDALEEVWNDYFGDLQETKFSTQENTLTANKFNSATTNIDFSNWSWFTDPTSEGYIGRKNVRGVTDSGYHSADYVYGHYFIEVTEQLNNIIDIINNPPNWVKLRTITEFFLHGQSHLNTKEVTGLQVQQGVALSLNTVASILENYILLKCNLQLFLEFESNLSPLSSRSMLATELIEGLFFDNYLEKSLPEHLEQTLSSSLDFNSFLSTTNEKQLKSIIDFVIGITSVARIAETIRTQSNTDVLTDIDSTLISGLSKYMSAGNDYLLEIVSDCSIIKSVSYLGAFLQSSLIEYGHINNIPIDSPFFETLNFSSIIYLSLQGVLESCIGRNAISMNTFQLVYSSSLEKLGWAWSIDGVLYIRQVYGYNLKEENWLEIY